MAEDCGYGARRWCRSRAEAMPFTSRSPAGRSPPTCSPPARETPGSFEPIPLAHRGTWRDRLRQRLDSRIVPRRGVVRSRSVVKKRGASAGNPFLSPVGRVWIDPDVVTDFSTFVDGVLAYVHLRSDVRECLLQMKADEASPEDFETYLTSLLESRSDDDPPWT